MRNAEHARAALASETPSALLDWNNNYGDDPDKAVCFHCSNLPKHFFQDVQMDFQEIIAGTVGKENTFGTCVGRVKAGAMSFARFSTDDRAGVMRGYVGEGRFTNDPLKRLAAPAWWRSALQKLLHYICENGFEHHVAAELLDDRARVHEAAVRYLGWEMYWHKWSTRDSIMAIVAGVDFGTLSVRVSILDSERGPAGSAIAEYPLHRKRKILITPRNATTITCARWRRPRGRR